MGKDSEWLKWVGFGIVISILVAIYFVKNTFDPDFWDYLLLELENFDGNKNSGYHDDLADCISMVYAVGVNHKTYQIPAILPINAPTSISGLSPVY